MAKFNIISQFLKDISFESPNVPDLFFKQDNGQAELEINIDRQYHIFVMKLIDVRKIYEGKFLTYYIADYQNNDNHIKV